MYCFKFLIKLRISKSKLCVLYVQYSHTEEYQQMFVLFINYK